MKKIQKCAHKKIAIFQYLNIKIIFEQGYCALIERTFMTISIFLAQNFMKIDIFWLNAQNITLVIFGLVIVLYKHMFIKIGLISFLTMSLLNFIILVLFSHSTSLAARRPKKTHSRTGSTCNMAFYIFTLFWL